jgi:hypothetical protein
VFLAGVGLNLSGYTAKLKPEALIAGENVIAYAVFEGSAIFNFV